MKLPRGVTKAQFSMALSVPARIHPDDAHSAVAADLQQSRSKKFPRELIEDRFIATLANLRGGWSRDHINTFLSYSRDRRFLERFARAMETGKPPMFDETDESILMSWRELRLSDPKAVEEYAHAYKGGPLPGLREWSPKAAAELLGIHPDAFQKRRDRLGLKPVTPYKVLRLTFVRDSARFDFLE